MDKRIPKGMHRMPDGTLMKDSEHGEDCMCERCMKHRDAYENYADGGIVEQAKELYDVAQNFPEEFDRAYDFFKGEMGKIYDFWADVFGFRRGGAVSKFGGHVKAGRKIGA
jgi:hypothetical protein